MNENLGIYLNLIAAIINFGLWYWFDNKPNLYVGILCATVGIGLFLEIFPIM